MLYDIASGSKRRRQEMVATISETLEPDSRPFAWEGHFADGNDAEQGVPEECQIMLLWVDSATRFRGHWTAPILGPLAC